MSHRFLSYLTVGLAVSAFVACGSDDDEDDDTSTQTAGTTTPTTAGFTTGSGGSNGTTTRGPTGSGGSGGANGNTTGASTTQGGGGAAGADGATGGAGGEAGMAGAPVLLDEEILHIVRTANLGEVDQAEIAVVRADDADVVDFAQTMVEDHGDGAEAAEALAEAEDLTLQPNSVSAMLRAESMATVGLLQSASDEEFDLVYMDAQVAAHTEVLSLLEDTLIPQADNPALEAFLVETRTHVSEHLESAESILEALE